MHGSLPYRLQARRGMTKKSFNPIGNKFGRLTITAELLRHIGKNGTSFRRWEATCSCGNITQIPTSAISGRRHVQSCGCLIVDRTTARSIVHGSASRKNRTPEYVAWKAMRQRCKADHKDREYYFDRGIGICADWDSFQQFLSDMGARPSSKHSIDRIDVNKGYVADNCRWATPVEQRRNQRRYMESHP